MNNPWFMMKRFSISIMGLCVSLLLSKQADADLLLQFGKDGQIGVTNISAVAGSTVTLDVYLTQTGIDPSNGVLGDFRLSPGSNTRGLGSFSFDISVTNTLNGITQLDVLPVDPTTFIYGAAFADQTGENQFLTPVGERSNVPTTQARFVGISPLTIDPVTFAATVTPAYVTEPFAIVLGPNTGNVVDNSIFLGTMAFDLKPTASGLYDVSFSTPSALQGPILGTDFFGATVDVTFGGTTFNVTAVPEPASLSLATLVGSFMCWRFRRRKQTS